VKDPKCPKKQVRKHLESLWHRGCIPALTPDRLFIRPVTINWRDELGAASVLCQDRDTLESLDS
jgi:hypothetical protein